MKNIIFILLFSTTLFAQTSASTLYEESQKALSSGNLELAGEKVKAAIDSHSELKDGFDMWKEDEVDGRQRIGEGALVPMLVKAIQELSAKNEALVARVTTLEG